MANERFGYGGDGRGCACKRCDECLGASCTLDVATDTLEALAKTTAMDGGKYYREG